MDLTEKGMNVIILIILRRFMKSFLVYFTIFLTFALFAEPDEVRVVAQENGKIKVDDSSFENEIMLQREPGSVIQVQLESNENFIGWEGLGACQDRSITSSLKTITVGSSAMTITAYFLNAKKDNLILNLF